jgi:cobalt-precorrin 5A hydrolase
MRATVGLDGVCEPCALLAAARGRLVLPKTTLNGVAVAVVHDAVTIEVPSEINPGAAPIPA